MIFKDMDAVKQHLKLGMTLPVYMVYGEDDLRKRGIVSKISSLVTGGGNGFDNYQFTGTASADEIADAAFELTFGGGRRCVIAEDIPFNSMGSAEFGKYEELVKEVSEMGGDTVLIFSFFTVSTEPKKKKSDEVDEENGEEAEAKKANCVEKLKKLVDKAGGVIKCAHATDSELATMIEREAIKYHCIIERDEAVHMIERCGNDSALLKNEIKKVAEYKRNGRITYSDIDLMTSPTPDVYIFKLTDRIAERNESGAFEVLSELMERGEPIPLVFNILGSAYLKMLKAKLAKSQGVSVAGLMEDYPKDFKTEWVANKTISAQSRYSKKGLLECLDILVGAEQRIKSSNGDERVILDETLARLFAVK